MALSAQHKILVAGVDGESYGSELPTFEEAANAIATLRPFSPGFQTGGGVVTQTGNKSNAVTINKICGQITTTSASLAAGSEVTLTVNNNMVEATDVVIVNHQSGGTLGAYLLSVSGVANGSFGITISNASTGSLSQALTLNFVIIKSVSN